MIATATATITTIATSVATATCVDQSRSNLMSLVFSEYPAILKECKRITSEKIPTKWTADPTDKQFLDYIDQILVGQQHPGVFVKKEVSSKYYCFKKTLWMELYHIYQYIENFLPLGRRPGELKPKLFTPFKEDTLEKIRCQYQEGTPVVVWQAFETLSGDNIASVRIDQVFEMSPRYGVTLTVFFTAETIHRAVTTLLGFMDLTDFNRQHSLANYVLDINQPLNKYLGVAELAKIVVNFLLVC